MRVVAYTRCSTAEQAESGTSLEAQSQAIQAEVARRGWELVGSFEDGGVSGKSMKGRSGLTGALGFVEAGEADAIVVAKLDRLSRSLLDFASLMEQAQKQGWGLVALDLGVDTSTPAGEMMANVLATFAQFERRLIGQRTKDALAVLKAEGVVLGRPGVNDEVTADVLRLKSKGLSYVDIASRLNALGVPTAHGGRQWWPTTVRKLVLRHS